MPPVTNQLSYEEFYKEQIFREEYYRQQAEFASKVLPIAFGIGKSYQEAEGFLTSGMKKLATKAADIPKWAKDAFDKAEDAKGYFDKLDDKNGLDELNIQALKDAAGVFNEVADLIKASRLPESEYYLQRKKRCQIYVCHEHRTLVLWNCVKDGSRPPEVCLQGLASNHPVLLR